jgi:putative transposase
MIFLISFHQLAEQMGCRIEAELVMSDHVHVPASVPPKPSVSSVVGYLKGGWADHVARHFLKKEHNYAGQHLWARGYSILP